MLSSSSSAMLLPFAFMSYFGNSVDFFLFSFLALFRNWTTFTIFITWYTNIGAILAVVKTAAASFSVLQVVRYIIGLCQKSSSSEGEQFLKPMFFPCRTSHTRLFPRKHSFAYSYLLTGIPLGWKGSVGGMISADEERKPSPWYLNLFSLAPWTPWFVVNGSQYLDRGQLRDGFRGKLDQFLRSQVSDLLAIDDFNLQS